MTPNEFETMKSYNRAVNALTDARETSFPESAEAAEALWEWAVQAVASDHLTDITSILKRWDCEYQEGLVVSAKPFADLQKAIKEADRAMRVEKDLYGVWSSKYRRTKKQSDIDNALSAWLDYLKYAEDSRKLYEYSRKLLAGKTVKFIGLADLINKYTN